MTYHTTSSQCVNCTSLENEIQRMKEKANQMNKLKENYETAQKMYLEKEKELEKVKDTNAKEIKDDDTITAEKVPTTGNVETIFEESKEEGVVSKLPSVSTLSPTAPVPAITITEPLSTLTCHETLSLDQQVPLG